MVRESTIRSAKRDTRQLEKQNLKLCDVIAETRMLQAYHNHLEDEQHKLNGGGLIPKTVAQKELDLGFEEEIRRLQEVLAVCEDRNNCVDKELQEQREDLQKAENANVLAHQEFKKSEIEAKKAREEKHQAEQELRELNAEKEQLDNVKSFRHKIHGEELDAVRDYVEQWLAEGDGADSARIEQEEHKRKESGASNRWGDNSELEKMLSDFANDYQRLLDDAYEMEKSQLLKELAILNARYNDLKRGVDDLLERREREQAEIQALKIKRAELEKELGQLTTERAHLRKQWEKERQEMEQQIDKINEEIQKKEAELAKLVAIDNELWKQACELELEIRGYKAMMVNENQIQPGFSIE